jgi:hypothetical protein
MKLLMRLWQGLVKVVGLILPIFAKAGDFRSWGRGVYWTIHVVLLVLLLVGLYFLNRFLEINKTIPNPRWIADIWLPVFFLLVYLLCFLGWWVWKLFGPEEAVSNYPDIDAAWDEAVRTLEAEGIGLKEAPLFLVLGRPAKGEQALFAAARLPLQIQQVPPRSEAPVHVSAYTDGIYVTCSGASLLGRHAALLANPNPGSMDSSEHRASPSRYSSGEVDPANKTINIDDMFNPALGPAHEAKAILDEAHAQGRPLTQQEHEQLRRLGRKPRPSILKDRDEVERWTDRLRHLCRLIIRDRRPYCPLNGILLLIPLAATDTEEDATQTGDICREDLSAARSVLQTNCPWLGLVCDLETAPGFATFVDRFSEKERQRRVGQRFPLMPALPRSQLPDLIDASVRWVCHAVFPTWIYKSFRVETPGREETSEVVRDNTQLFQLLGQMQERQKRLSRILNRAVAAIEENEPLLFGGCYVAGTGLDPDGEQAFVAGVLRRLIDEDQNYVSWTQKAATEEEDYRRWTQYGYGGLALFFVALVALAAFFLWPKKGTSAQESRRAELAAHGLDVVSKLASGGRQPPGDWPNRGADTPRSPGRETPA